MAYIKPAVNKMCNGTAIVSDVDFTACLPEWLKKGRFAFWKDIIKEGKKKATALKVEGNALATADDYERLATCRLVVADKTNPADSVDFMQAQTALEYLPADKVDGLGVMLSEETCIVCLELDNCINEDGTLTSFAAEKVKRFNGAYIEISQSGKGLHIFFLDEYGVGVKKRGKHLEVHSDKAFIALTGHVYDEHGGENAVYLGATDELIRDVFVGADELEHMPVDVEALPTLATDELLEVIRRSKAGAKFERLFKGDITGFEDSSYLLEEKEEEAKKFNLDCTKADAALCSMLCFWANGNYRQIKEIWQMSELWRRERHVELTEAYARRTICAAIAVWKAKGGAHFEPRKGRAANAVVMPEKVVEPIVNLPLPKDWKWELNCPADFALSDAGTEAAFETRKGVMWRRVSHSVILVEKMITNVDSGLVALKMRHFSNGGWHNLPPLPQSVISTNAKIASLAEYGVDVRADNAGSMAKWVADFIAANNADIERVQAVDAPGWQKDGSFVFPNSDGKYQLSETIRADTERFYTQAGNPVVLKSILADMHDNDIFMLAVGAALAAPLVKYLGAQGNIAIHFYGNTGCGKSTLSKFAFSLFGNPNVTGAIPNADATKSGLENVFDARRDLPACIEDIDSVNDEKTLRVIRSLPYQYANAVGRTRANKDGGNRRTAGFSGTLETTGEHPITDAGSKGGAIRRVLGIFVPNDYLGGTEKERIERAARINGAIEKNYGLFGRPWIAAIEGADRNALRDAFKQMLYGGDRFKGLQNQFPDKGSWHLSDLALIAVANAFFSVKFLDAPDLDAALQEEYARAGRIAATLPGMKEISDAQRAKQLLIDIYHANPNRFNDDDYHQPKYGFIAQNSNPPSVAFYPTYLHELFEKNGFNAATVIKQLAEEGFIERPKGSKRITVVMRTPDGNKRVYKIPLANINPTDGDFDETLQEEKETPQFVAKQPTAPPTTSPRVETPTMVFDKECRRLADKSWGMSLDAVKEGNPLVRTPTLDNNDDEVDIPWE